MKPEDRKGLYYGVVFIKQFCFFIFIMGLIFNWDGVKIILSRNEYRSGDLQVTDLESNSAVDGPTSTIFAHGLIKNTDINSGLSLGNTGKYDVDSLLRRRSGGKEIVLPVWYKNDGKLTLDRYVHEQSFPLARIIRNLIKYILLLNGPFLFLYGVQEYMKRRYDLKGK